jgi:hypothetical protein
MVILIEGKGLEYQGIEVINSRAAQEKIREYIMKHPADFSNPNFWDALMIEKLTILDKLTTGQSLMLYGLSHDIDLEYSGRRDIVSMALDFFDNVERRRIKKGANYILVGGLKAENIGSSWKNARFHGRTQILIPNPDSYLEWN